MTAPTCFTVRRGDSADDYDARHCWTFDGPESEAIWLARLGPTSWALGRILDRGAPAGRSSLFTVATLASQLGTSPQRLWTSVERLVRFGVLTRADVGNEVAFMLPLRLPELDDKQWRRLPDVVRALHSDLAPPARAHRVG